MDDISPTDDVGSNVDIESPMKTTADGMDQNTDDVNYDQVNEDNQTGTYELSPTTKKLNAEQE